jgi:hypothetical protein
MKKLLTALFFCSFASIALAQDDVVLDTKEIPIEPTDPKVERTGKIDPREVIAIAKDVIALGEKVYELVYKGKPVTNITTHSPISVLPKDKITGQVVDVMDLENCSMPTRKKYQTSVKRAGVTVAKFKYLIVFTYNCSYEGKGKYIQAAMLEPIAADVSYGWDFNAEMKYQGMMNHSSKADPVVGAFLSVKYSLKSWRSAFERNDTIHITGKGDVKNHSLE